MTSFFNPFGTSLPNTNWVPKKAKLRRWQIGKSPRTQQPGSPCFDLNTPPLPSHPFPLAAPVWPSSTIAPRLAFPQFLSSPLPLFALRAAATLPLRGLQIHLLFPPWRAAPCLAAPAPRGAVRWVGRASWISRSLVGWSWCLLAIPTACWVAMAVASPGAMAAA